MSSSELNGLGLDGADDREPGRGWSALYASSAATVRCTGSRRPERAGSYLGALNTGSPDGVERFWDWGGESRKFFLSDDGTLYGLTR